MQQRRADEAMARWGQSRSATALIAALWSAPPSRADVPALIAAAAAMPHVAAFATASVLRVRLLIQRNDVAAAREALASLPLQAAPGIGAEAVNLFRAARLATAASLDELLANAPREIVLSAAQLSAPGGTLWKFDRPAWDDDVAAVFNGRLPLDQLVAAAESTRLPPRLRTRVAQSASRQAVLLNRADAGRRAAAVLHRSCSAQDDLMRYAAAPTDDARRRARVLTLLRTPSLRSTWREAAHLLPQSLLPVRAPRNW
jgi:hypothetical protein